jgi:hypothetical protein
VITHCRRANEKGSKLIKGNGDWETLMRRKTQQRKQSTGIVMSRTRPDDCCGPHNGMVALPDDWYNGCAPSRGMMLWIQEKQTGSVTAIGNAGPARYRVKLVLSGLLQASYAPGEVIPGPL